MTYRVLSLFAGIGGFDLGLERTGGFRTVAFCEIDPFCRRVLAKHWPEVPCYDDVRELTGERLAADGIEVDCIVGGFPCQDISYAGKGAGLGGERSGLWSEYARLIGELRPRFVVVENVAALLRRGLSAILGTVASLGYDADWHCIPASAVGAPHRRDRVWIIANARGEQHESRGLALSRALAAQFPFADPDTTPMLRPEVKRGKQDGDFARAREVADAASVGWQQRDKDAGRGCQGNGEAEGSGPWCCGWWSAEPDVGRVAHGVPARVDRLRSLGNAVVPQIPELIGRAILAATERQAA